MTPQVYAQALIQAAARDGADAQSLVANLKTVLARTKQERMLPAIAREFRLLARRQKLEEPTVTVARQGDLELLYPSIKEVLVRLSASDTHRTTVDDSLIGGFVVTAHNRRFDASDKSMLANLYQTLAHQEV